jgi:tetratricopeptide (TPR) repeat protein
VLEGSVRRVGSQVRVNTQLIDAESDTHLWAQRFDRDAGDLFAVQDEITGRIAIALDLEMVAAEAARPAAHPDALDCILRGRAAKSAEQLAARAVAALPRSPLAHFAKGQVLRVRGRYAEAIHEYETVLALNRNWVAALAHIGRCKIFLGLLEEAILAQEEAIASVPAIPLSGIGISGSGRRACCNRALTRPLPGSRKRGVPNPAPPFLHLYLASAYALKGDSERGIAELLEARRLSSSDLYPSIARVRALADYGVPAVRALFEATYFAGLRKAGMLEE